MDLLPRLLLAFAVLLLPAPGHDRPHILLVNVDDFGFMDVSANGGRIPTPNLDRLAVQGLRCTRGYTAASNCAPSRAAMLSGMVSPRTGVYTVGSSERGRARDRALVPTPNTAFVAEEVELLPASLHAAGYRTAHFGKWHLSPDPHTRGFDHALGGGPQGGTRSHFAPWTLPGLEQAPEGQELTERLVDETIAWLRAESAAAPCFVHLAPYAVHTPIQTRPEWLPAAEAIAAGKTQLSAPYVAMVQQLDRELGRLFAFLDASGLAEQMLVIVTGDNGSLDHLSDQAPLRAGKGSYTEGGIRVPLLIRWPGVVAANTTDDTPVSQLDFYPSLLAVAGGEIPEHPLDGVDLDPLLRGESLPERALFFHFPIYLEANFDNPDLLPDPRFFRTRPGSAIVVGNWKLLEYFEDGRIELYDLAADPGERHNLAGEQPERAAGLLQRLRAWREQVHAPVPTERNPEFRGE